MDGEFERRADTGVAAVADLLADKDTGPRCRAAAEAAEEWDLAKSCSSAERRARSRSTAREAAKAAGGGGGDGGGGGGGGGAGS